MKQPKIDQPTPRPTRKVTAATLGAALANFAIVALNKFAPGALDGMETETHALLTIVAVFVAGYAVRDRAI